jgi:hypothetical protein
MRKAIAICVFAVSLLAATGCGGGGEKGKNKEKDVPKAAKSEGT